MASHASYDVFTKLENMEELATVLLYHALHDDVMSDMFRSGVVNNSKGRKVKVMVSVELIDEGTHG